MSDNLFGWSDAAWRLFDQIGILFGVIMGTTWVGGLVIAFFKREAIRRWLTRNRFPNVGAEMANAHHWDAIAFTISRPDLPLWVIEACRPSHVGLIASEASWNAAQEIARQAEKQGIAVHVSAHIENPDNPAEARAKAHLVLARMREAGARDIAVDITGGKTPMSLGAFMAAEEMGISSLYVTIDYGADLRRPDISTAKIHCISSPE